MKVIIFIYAVLAMALAAPQQDATITKFVNENIGVDGYNFAFETSDGTSRQETGVLNNIGSENEAISVNGNAVWKDEKSGQTISLEYVADENGYRPKFSIKS